MRWPTYLREQAKAGIARRLSVLLGEDVPPWRLFLSARGLWRYRRHGPEGVAVFEYQIERRQWACIEAVEKDGEEVEQEAPCIERVQKPYCDPDGTRWADLL